MIDLRSDTVTRPTPEMRQVIFEATVGDAVIDTDPTVEKLEQRTAEILGKEAAVFMPSGSMTNQIAVRVHCDRGSEFLCEADCHIYHYEQAAFAGLSGLSAKTITGDRGSLRVEHLAGKVNPVDDHHALTRLLCLENTHNRWGGRIQPQDDVVQACWWASGQGLKTHLDGARLWNAAIATGKTEAELCEPFDSISVCFSKGLGAPVGSALAGDRSFIVQARRARKLFGGAMRQAGIIAAGALHAIEHHRQRLLVDHDHAKMLGDAAESCGALSIYGGEVHTNIVMIDIDRDWGNSKKLQDRLAEHQIQCFAIGDQAIRLVTHLDIDASQIERACKVLKAAVG